MLDQKTGSQLGQLSYAVAALLKQKDLSITTQPLNLLKSGPESKVLMSMQLKVTIIGYAKLSRASIVSLCNFWP